MSTNDNDKRIAFLAIGSNGYGKGFTENQAVSACRANARKPRDSDKPTMCQVFRVLPGTWVDGFGIMRWNLPADAAARVKAEYERDTPDDLAPRIEPIQEPFRPEEIGERVLFAPTTTRKGRRFNDLFKEASETVELADELINVDDDDAGDRDLSYQLGTLAEICELLSQSL